MRPHLAIGFSMPATDYVLSFSLPKQERAEFLSAVNSLFTDAINHPTKTPHGPVIRYLVRKLMHDPELAKEVIEHLRNESPYKPENEQQGAE